MNRFLLRQRVVKEAASKELARAAATAAQRREFSDLCQRRSGSINRVDLAEAVDGVLLAGPAGGIVTLVPMSEEVR